MPVKREKKRKLIKNKVILKRKSDKIESDPTKNISKHTTRKIKEEEPKEKHKKGKTIKYNRTIATNL